MGVEIEVQNDDTYKQIRAREVQMENIERLNEIDQRIEEVDFQNIESNTNDIKQMVVSNLEAQPNLDDLKSLLTDAIQGISTIKKNQDNLTKKLNTIQKTVNNLDGDS